jgi:hypothetical protein
MAAPIARVGAGVQLAGVAPATVHVAFVAASDPALVQVAVQATTAPAAALAGNPLAVATMSACIAAAVGATVAEGGEAGPVPTELIAATVKVYPLPFSNPPNVNVVSVEFAVLTPALELAVTR